MRFTRLASLVAVAALAAPAAAHAQAPTCPAPIHLDQGSSVALCPGVKTFKADFLNRVWTFDGAVDQVDLEQHTLDMTTSSIENLPKRFASQDDALLDQDTHVNFRPSTRVYGPDGQLVTQDHLDYAENVAVRGKLTAPKRWAHDADGDPVPTVDAKRLYITDYVQDASQAQDSADAADATDPAAQDPTPGDGVITSLDVEIWIHLHLGR
jgi:hypothetical protein